MKLFSGARPFFKRIFDNIGNERLKHNLLQAIPYWTASLITGVVAVFYAKSFSIAEELTARIIHFHSWLIFIVMPACFLLSWWIVKVYAPYSRGSGIPQVMAAIEFATPKHHDKIKSLLSIRIIIVKVISSLIMVVGGGVVGREGPTIQIAGSIFRKINELLPEWWPKISKKNMIMTGAAAGLAAAFNTPLGGIVFAVEELTRMHISYYRGAIFTAVIIAGLTAQSLLGSYLYLGFPTVNNLSSYILLVVTLVAVISGVMGSGMSMIIRKLFIWKSGFNKTYQHIIYLLVCSLSMASMAYFIGDNVLGSGKSLMMHALFTDDKYSHWYIPIVRTIGPVLSFTTGTAGGVFAPGLTTGATIGSVISGWFDLSSSDTNLLILAGMVAFLTGITRAPFTSAILVLEMTNKNNLILHLMMAGIIANFVSAIVDKHSLYDYLKHQYMHDLISQEKNKAT